MVDPDTAERADDTALVHTNTVRKQCMPPLLALGLTDKQTRVGKIDILHTQFYVLIATCRSLAGWLSQAPTSSGPMDSGWRRFG